MLRAILVLLRARWHILRNTFWRAGIGNRIFVVVLVPLAGLAAWGCYALLRGAVSLLLSPSFRAALEQAARENPPGSLPTDVAPFLDALPGAALFAALLLLVFTSFGSVLSSLYLSGDLDMLVAAPVPMRAVFLVKFLSGLVTPYGILLLLIGPALAGYGAGRAFGPAYYATLAAVLLLFPLLPTGLGALLVMAVVRVIPARRAREIVGVIGGLIGVAWYVASQLSTQIAPRVATVDTLEGLRRLDTPLLPSAWAARALLGAGQADWPLLLGYGGLFAAASLAIFAACLLLAERLYYAGWSNMATQGGRIAAPARARRSDGPLLGGLVSRLLSPPSAAILWKDLRVFPRDLRNLQQVIFPLAFAGVWVFQLLRGGRGDMAPDEIGRALGLLFPAGISFFVCLSLSSALGGPSISREGRGYWLLKIAPISARRILVGKLALAYLPFPTAGTLFVAALAALQGASLRDALLTLALVLLAGLGATAITLGFGAAFPRFDWENPQQQRTTRAGCLAPIAYMSYLALTIGVALGLPAIAALFDAGLMVVTAVIGWLLAIVLTIGVVWASLTLGSARLERADLA